MITRYKEIKAYVTKDGSVIRELMHPEIHDCSNLSLAEATVHPGASTLKHHHGHSEEIYHILSGEGIVVIDDISFNVSPGDTVHIGPGCSHQIKNTGNSPLRILCCCSPPYSHSDTHLD